MDWADLPSLPALRAFDALARQGSFSAAARSLGVTHAAVAQHVRALEAHFGLSLANRHGRAMQLTPVGRELAEALEGGFDRIFFGVSRIAVQQPTDRPLTVGLAPDVAGSWVAPRIAGFRAAHPDIGLRLQPTTDAAEPGEDGVDVVIRFGTGDWPGTDAVRISASPLVVVGAPGYARDLRDPWHYRWFYCEPSGAARAWARDIGADFDDVGAQELPDTDRVLEAVRQGLGLSIQPKNLINDDLSAGRVVVLREAHTDGPGHFAVTKPSATSPGVTAFLNWLEQKATGQASA